MNNNLYICLKAAIILSIALFCSNFVQLEAQVITPNPSAVYAQLSSSHNQMSMNPAIVNMEQIDGISGLTLLTSNKVVINQPGTYFILATGQVGAVNFNPPGYFNLWFIRNNQSIPNTGTNKYLDNRLDKVFVTSHVVIQLKQRDTISVGYSSTDSSIGLIASPASEGESAIPSINFSMYRIQ